MLATIWIFAQNPRQASWRIFKFCTIWLGVFNLWMVARLMREGSKRSRASGCRCEDLTENETAEQLSDLLPCPQIVAVDLSNACRNHKQDRSYILSLLISGRRQFNNPYKTENTIKLILSTYHYEINSKIRKPADVENCNIFHCPRQCGDECLQMTLGLAWANGGGHAYDPSPYSDNRIWNLVTR